MTSRATFGDCANAASGQLARALSLAESPTMRTAYSAEFRRELSHVLSAMERYFDDFTIPALNKRRGLRLSDSRWSFAVRQGRRQLHEAAVLLKPDSDDRFAIHPRRPASPVGDCLRSASAAMAAGRDLLHTHLTVNDRRIAVGRSEWAPVITSAPASAALLLGLGRWARLLDASGSHFVRATAASQLQNSGAPQDLDGHQRLRAACESLREVSRIISSAHREMPVATSDLALLYAIPVNAPPARRLPAERDTRADLRQGAISSAERVRRAARISAPDARWAPELTAAAMREGAASATAISHHCAILLRTVATRAAELGNPARKDELTRSAEAAENARDSWLTASRSWNQFAAEGNAELSPLAAETADLAQWTERLAYADGAWSLSQGEARPVRPPESLAPELDDVREIVAVTHHAAHTLSRLAVDSDHQIRQAAEAGRFYMPSRTSSDGISNWRPFVHAPPAQLDNVLGVYKDARHASDQLTDAIADSAAALSSSSTTITAARSATRRKGPPNPEAAPDDDRMAPANRLPRTGMPGHFELILSHLGQTDPEALKRAAAIDHLGEQLLTDTTRIAKPTDLAVDMYDSIRELGVAERARTQPAPNPRRTIGERERTRPMEAEAEL